MAPSDLDPESAIGPTNLRDATDDDALNALVEERLANSHRWVRDSKENAAAVIVDYQKIVQRRHLP